MAELTRILYLEDEPDIQAVAKIALENVGGFELNICSRGHEALENAEAFNPDLLLFDVMLPDMDGPSTLEKIRQTTSLKTTPAIFMTAKVQPQEIAQYKSQGAIEVISKPFDPMTLAQQIRDIWDKQVG